MERSGFFDAHVVGNEYDRVYLAESFAKYFASFIGNGVFGARSTELQVRASEDGGMSVYVKPGQGYINGYWYENTSDLVLRIDNADGVLNRIDNIVLQWGLAERSMNLVVKKGTFAAEAVAPALLRDAEHYELKLAEVSVRAGAINIYDVDIVDKRLDTSVCGPVVGAVEQIDSRSYGSQLNGFIERYIARVEFEHEQAADVIRALIADLHGLLDEEVASQLLARIIDLENAKLPKPVGQTLTEGYLYQQEDGSTKLLHGGDVVSKFKFSMLVDNGADGTPGAIEYLDDCYGFTPMTMNNGVLDEGDWAGSPLLDCFKPCVIDNDSDEPAYFLRKDDLTKKLDGTAATLTGADGDVMIQVSKLYGRVTKVGSKAKISIMNFKEYDDCFCFNDIAGVENDYLYRGRYKAGKAPGDSSNVMRSISGVNPMVSMTRAIGRTRAAARGTGYHQNNPYLVFLWEFMFMLLFKTRQSQGALGKGRTGASAAEVCGWSNNKNWIWGNQNGTDGVVFLGVEDFYGNVWEWVDGIVFNALTYKLTRDPSRYNDTGNNYEISAPSGLTAVNNSKYVTQLQFTNDLGCLPANSGLTGSGSNTFFCDYLWVAESVQVVHFGGSWSSGVSAGTFCWRLYDGAGDTGANIGSRLCRK